MRQERRCPAGCRRTDRRRRGRRRHPLQFRRSQAIVQSAGQCAWRQRCRQGRAHRHSVVAIGGGGDGARGRLESRLHLDPAVHPVRRGRARVSYRRQPGPGRRHRHRQPGQVGGDTGPVAEPEAAAGGRRRPRWPGHARFLVGGRARLGRLHPGGDPRRGPRADHLHFRDNRQSEGRVARPSGAARPPAGGRVLQRVPSPARRPDVDPGGMGVDRRADERADELLAPRRPRSRPARAQVRSGEGAGVDGPPRGQEHVHAADGAQDDPSGGGSPRTVRRYPAHPDLRRRADGSRTARLVPGGAGPHAQRILRPDRVQPGGRQLRPNHGGQARIHGPSGARPHRRDHRRRRRGVTGGDRRQDRRPSARSGDDARVLASTRGDPGQVHRRLAGDGRSGSQG